MPRFLKSRLKNSAQLMATATLPMAYSMIKSQPMIHATSSPIVA